VRLAPLVRSGVGAALCLSCSLLNGEDPCADVAKSEAIVHVSRQENQELLEHTQHLALISESRALVAFKVLDFGFAATDPTTFQSSARLALLSVPSGTSLVACIGEDVSDEDSFASQVSVVPVRLTVAGEQAAALVGWIDGEPYAPHRARMRFVDNGGCPIGSEGSFDPFGRAASRLSFAWSERDRAVLAVMHDERDLFSVWVDAPGQGVPRQLAQGSPSSPGVPELVDAPGVAVADDGRAFVAWFDGGRGFRGLALAPDGAVTGPFELGLPVEHVNSDYGVSCAVSAGPERFVAVGTASTAVSAVPAAHFREFSFDGTPLASARAVDPSDRALQTLPNAAYLPSGTLFISWHSGSAGGTLGRFFRPDGAPRFCALGCNEEPFALGARATNLGGGSAARLVGDDLWVVHGAGDTRGMGVFLWRAAYRELFPVKPD
jgi:hypothetical protein